MRPAARGLVMPDPRSRQGLLSGRGAGDLEPASKDVGGQLVEVGIGGVEGAGPVGIAAAVMFAPGDTRGVFADLVRGCSSLADAITKDHVDLFRLVEPHGDLGGKQVPEINNLFAGSW